MSDYGLKEWVLAKVKGAAEREAIVYSEVMRSQDAIPAYRDCQQETSRWHAILHLVDAPQGLPTRAEVDAVVDEYWMMRAVTGAKSGQTAITRAKLLALIPTRDGMTEEGQHG